MAAPNSLPRSVRLRVGEEFKAVFSARRLIRGRLLLLYRRNRPENQTARLGLVVAKRLCRSAARRNLIRRVARESFRTHRTSLPPCDLVIRLASQLPGKAKPDLRRLLRLELADLFRELVRASK